MESLQIQHCFKRRPVLILAAVSLISQWYDELLHVGFQKEEICVFRVGDADFEMTREEFQEMTLAKLRSFRIVLTNPHTLKTANRECLRTENQHCNYYPAENEVQACLSVKAVFENYYYRRPRRAAEGLRTFTKLRNTPVTSIVEKFQFRGPSLLFLTGFDFMVVDEVHQYLSDSFVSQCLMAVHSKSTVLLTGTPFGNVPALEMERIFEMLKFPHVYTNRPLAMMGRKRKRTDFQKSRVLFAMDHRNGLTDEHRSRIFSLTREEVDISIGTQLPQKKLMRYTIRKSKLHPKELQVYNLTLDFLHSLMATWDKERHLPARDRTVHWTYLRGHRVCPVPHYRWRVRNYVVVQLGSRISHRDLLEFAGTCFQEISPRVVQFCDLAGERAPRFRRWCGF
jgi:hypothetical protein